MRLYRSNTFITRVIAVCNVQSGIEIAKRLYTAVAERVSAHTHICGSQLPLQFDVGPSNLETTVTVFITSKTVLSRIRHRRLNGLRTDQHCPAGSIGLVVMV